MMVRNKLKSGGVGWGEVRGGAGVLRGMNSPTADVNLTNVKVRGYEVGSSVKLCAQRKNSVKRLVPFCGSTLPG